MNRADRRARKAELEHAIEQQRIDLLVAASRWQSASRSIDRGWHTLVRFRAPLLAVGAMLLYRGVRRPGGVVRLAGRLTTGALLVKRARRLLH
ncbi:MULTISPECIES: YqjK family protein [unclassified Halomonas]|uniref:YqjK family protein n=1 Tax=unclassified Halomonas TaxID=2609666 RepID=UPI0024689C56|nr:MULTISPECIES: YqjK family protein [unclassified Halomonas]